MTDKAQKLMPGKNCTYPLTPLSQPEAMEQIAYLEAHIRALEQELGKYTANERVADCVDCGGSIWFREARITDESGTYHPMCRVQKHREAAEQAAEGLRKELERVVDALRRLTEPITGNQKRRLYEALTLAEQALGKGK